ncbi:hypothetical protein D9613_008984 [Agrocybe pediades]|uniref:Uncharacterized protein n=1 Tax=Agrocybe pediades TaxID=84607 RepID=A0A8H4R4M1_9AGAR|nr:hypothetical protein D9613_008984 [Agrocybe pediades]
MPVPSSHTERVLAQLGLPENRKDASLDDFLSIARWIPRGISPWLNLDAVFNVGIRDSEDPPSPSNVEYYNTITALSNHFPPLIAAFVNDRDAYDTFLKRMSKAMREARSQDTHRISEALGVKILPLDDKKPISPAIPDAKALRGWANIETSRALVPLKHKREFDLDPSDYRKRAEEGTIKLTASDLPSFLYPVGTEYNAEKIDEGLFRGHIIIHALRSIYTGKSSISRGHRKSEKQSQAELHGMRSVTPQAVAYAAVQVYISLTSLEQWGSKFGYFKVEKFYHNCIELFTRVPDSPWAKETLEFLTSQLPSLTRKRKQVGGTLDDTDDDDDEDPTGIFSLWEKRNSEEATVNGNRGGEPLNLSGDEEDTPSPVGSSTATAARRVTSQGPSGPSEQPVAPLPARQLPPPTVASPSPPLASPSAPPHPRETVSPLPISPSPPSRLLRDRPTALTATRNEDALDLPPPAAKRARGAKTPGRGRGRGKRGH